MNDKEKISLKKPEILFLSLFGIGFLPKAPGTFGSLATICALYFLAQFNPPFVFFLPIIIIGTFTSSFLVEHLQKLHHLKDPQWIVVDEVLGMTVAWLFLQSPHWGHHILIFILFRIFDIFKFGPAKYFDQKMKHGAGVILDDIVSGLYAGLVYSSFMWIKNMA